MRKQSIVLTKCVIGICMICIKRSAKLYDDLINDKITESVFDKMLEKTQKEQADIKKELSQNESVLNTEEKLDAQSQQLPVIG